MTHLPEPVGYHRVHLEGRSGVWRPLVGIMLVAVLSLLLAPLVWQLLFVGVGAARGEDLKALGKELGDLSDPTPRMLAHLMLSLASGIPAVWLVSRLLHGVRLGFVTSVVGGMRWGFFLRCLGLAVVALVATLVVGALMPSGATDGVEVTGPAEFTDTVRDFLLVVVLLVPFQAAAEEYVFRGYLTQAVGGFFASPALARTLAVVVPAVLFALAHGAQDPPIFFDRLAFGLTAGVIVLVTGGLEAAIAMHVLNNLVAFCLALAFSDMASALQPTGGTWWSLPGTLTRSLVFLVLVWFVARRTGLESTRPGAVLASS